MKALRKPLSLFMAMLMCLGIFAGTGTTAFAAGETMTTYMVEFPRASDPNKAGWGHSAMNFLGGWSTGENNGFTIHTQDSFNGKVIYCIEPGVSVHSGDQFTGRGEDFWDDYPSDLNPTIPPDTIKEYIGRIMTYGWQGNASTSWMTDDPEDASKMAGAIATQLLVWETVVGERDSQFNHVDANAQGKNNIAEYTSPENPLYSEIFSQYSAIESAVKRHTMLPSFFSSTADAGAYELKWDGQQYSLTLTDTNGVLGDYTFTSNITGLNFSVDGNQLTITSSQAIKGSVTVKAEKISAQRSGVVVWTDGIIGGGKQDFATYGETVSDYMVGYLNLEVKTGNMKLVKTSEDGQVAGISFTITGEGYSATKTTNEAGEIDISDLNPGVYTVTEQSIDKYEPQESQRVTIVSGQTATVTFSNVLKRGSLEVTKTSEDGLVEGMTFHLYGTSLSGQPVDEYAVTDGNGVARFENVLIGTGYVLEEVDTPIRYVVPDSQTATIEWNEVTHKSVNNVLKKFRVTVTKSDVETGAPQGDGSLAGATYGLYKGDTLIDSYTTDENGQFTTGYYVCDSDWTIREINPSEGYLLDSSIHKVGAEPELYEIELNDTANDVTEQVIKGDIAIIKHTDDGETQIETPESGAEFQVFLKSAGSYENAKESERDVLVCDENGFAQSKKLPYGTYIVRQTKGWEGRELMDDFEVYIAQDGQTYRYLINNANFESFIKVVKVDAETGVTIPYAGAGFQIYRPDGSKVEMTFTYPTPTTIDTFYTNSEGYLVTPEKLEYGAGYSLVEVQAPYGYVLDSTPVYFDVTEDNSSVEGGVTVIEVTKPNMAQKGIIKVSKTGEVFSSVTENEGVYQPVYEVQGLPGAVFEITALEDVYTLDGTLRYDVLEMSGSRAVWKEVLAVYAVKTTTDSDNAQEVATMDDEKLELLKDIFWQMNEISSSTSTQTETVIETSDDGNGNIVETETTVTQTYLYITVSHKTAEEMANQFGFNEDQREQMAELLADENNSLWSQVLYGITGGDGEIVTVALSQVGNVGGEPYWSWYGFGSRVEWCACFVSWCANECGYIEAGVIPKFAACASQGVPWFQERGLWQDNSYEPRPGDIIFFDWDDGGQDGSSDHVGIVEKVENGRVYTVEGNSGDSVRQNSYPVGYYEIYGYGTPAC